MVYPRFLSNCVSENLNTSDKSSRFDSPNARDNLSKAQVTGLGQQALPEARQLQAVSQAAFHRQDGGFTICLDGMIWIHAGTAVASWNLPNLISVNLQS